MLEKTGHYGSDDNSPDLPESDLESLRRRQAAYRAAEGRLASSGQSPAQYGWSLGRYLDREGIGDNHGDESTRRCCCVGDYQRIGLVTILSVLLISGIAAGVGIALSSKKASPKAPPNIHDQAPPSTSPSQPPTPSPTAQRTDPPSEAPSQSPSMPQTSTTMHVTLLYTFNRQSTVHSVAFNPDSSRLVSGGCDPQNGQHVVVWDPVNGGQDPLWNSVGNDDKPHDNCVNSVRYNPAGSAFASGSSDTFIQLWEIRSSSARLRFSGHTARVNFVTWHPDGTLIASASSDNTTKIWSATSGNEEHSIPHNGSVQAVAFHPLEPKQLATSSRSSQGFSIILWDFETLTPIRQLLGHGGSVRSISFSPSNSQWLASASDDRTVRIWNTQSGEILQEFRGHQKAVRSVAWSPDGTHVVSGSQDQTVRIWKVVGIGAGELVTTLKGHLETVRSVDWGRGDGTLIASGSNDNNINIWKILG